MGVSVVSGVLLKKTIDRKIFQRCIMVLACSGLYGVFFWLIDPTHSRTIITLTIQLMAIIVYTMLVEDSFEDTMRRFSNIVIIIASISLFFWVFGSLGGYIKPNSYLYTTWSSSNVPQRINNYYNLYFENQRSLFFGLSVNRIIRNTAIFTEAPMACMIFMVAFLYEIFLNMKKSRIRTAILLIAIISTISTSGIVAVVMAFGCNYIFSKLKSNGQLTLKIIIAPLAIVVAVISINFVIEQKLGTISGSTRLDDFVAGYKAWRDSPVFGNGYGNSSAYQQYMSSFRSNNLGFSNSIMQLLAFGGLYLTIPYIVVAVKCINRLFKTKNWEKLSFYVIYIFVFIITVSPFQMLTFYLFVSMAREKIKKLDFVSKVAR
ncbi:MAG: O-antigen ligase family protein [Oscillospiraceae bacterium]|nr:O-antigen ligase family protein [Oscillospiraceae bacterium]